MAKRTLSEFFDAEEPDDSDSEKFIEHNPALPDEDIVDPAVDTEYWPSIVPQLWYVYSVQKNQRQRERMGDELVKKLMQDLNKAFDGLRRSERIFLVRNLERELEYKPKIREPGFVSFFNYCKYPYKEYVKELKQRIMAPSDEVKPTSATSTKSEENHFCKSMSLTPRSTKIRDELTKYNFNEFAGKKFTITGVQKITSLLMENKGLPFHIALLHHIGFLEYVKIEHCKNIKAKRNKLFAEIFQANERQVRGNINVIANHRTKEDTKTYTSHIHLPKVLEITKGLLKGTIGPVKP